MPIISNSNAIDDVISEIGMGPWNLMYFAAACFCQMTYPVVVIGAEFLAPPELEFTCIRPTTAFINDTNCEVRVEVYNGSQYTPCQQFVYSNEVYSNTITMQFDLVCNRSFYRQLFQASQTFGWLLGTPLSGQLSDRYGRRKISHYGIVVAVAVTATILLSPWLWLVIFARFLSGLCCGIYHVATYTLAVEACPKRHRSVFGIVTALPYALCTSLLAIIAYWRRNWRDILIVANIPLLVLVIITSHFVMDESPRWLLSRGRTNDMLRVLTRAAKFNGKLHVMQENDLEQISQVATENTSESKENETFFATLLSLFASQKMRLLTLGCSGILFTFGAMFISLPLRSDFFSSPFMYVVVLGLCEVPSYSITVPIVNKTGRKPFVAACLAISCAILGTMTALIATNTQTNTVMLLLSSVAYCIVTCGYQVMNMYSVEVFPTTVRALGFSLVTAACICGSFVSPTLEALLPRSLQWVIIAVMTSFCPLAMWVIFQLPETNKSPLQQQVS